MISKFSVIFPGQASQHLGMLKILAKQYLVIKEVFAESSEILGYDMWKLIQDGPIEELNKTYKAQPVILTASVAIWRLWREQGGGIPKIMAGHSLGEYSALVCSGAIDFSHAVLLVMKRGLLMQQTVPFGFGAMSAIIGLTDDIVISLCQKISKREVVELSVFNSPKYVIISGDRIAVERVNFLCKQAGAKHVILLPITIPSHCKLMKPMALKFSEILNDILIRSPRIPVINNVDVKIEKNPTNIRDALVRQLYMPVRWNEIMQYFVEQKITICLEMGPNKVLTKIIKNAKYNLLNIAINSPNTLLEAIYAINV